MCITESLSCIPETNIILKINYTSEWEKIIDAHLFVHFQELVRGSVKPAADSLVLLTWLGSGDAGSFARQN